MEHCGSRRNNLAGSNHRAHHVQSCVVLHDPGNPDAGGRFKKAYQTREYDSRVAVAYSADGLTWNASPRNPVGYWLEVAGGMRFNGVCNQTGQGGNHARRLRNLVTYAPYDFENWSTASALGMQRLQSSHGFDEWQNTAGRQIHLGAALWNRHASPSVSTACGTANTATTAAWRSCIWAWP